MPVYNYVTKAALDKALLEDRSYKGFNSNAFLFPQFKVGAFKTDGSVGMADASNPALQKLVGVAAYDILSGRSGLFVQRGIIEGAISHLSTLSGDTIYLGAVAGTLVSTPPTGLGVAQIVVGYASKNITTGLISDLRLDLGGVASVSGGGGGSGSVSSSISCQNGSGITLVSGTPVAWMDSGQIIEAHANGVTYADAFGILTETTIAGAYGPVLFSGIVPDICTPLLAVPGKPVFLGVTGGLTLTAPSNSSHSIVRIGYAVAKSGVAGAATDLLLDVEILFVP